MANTTPSQDLTDSGFCLNASVFDNTLNIGESTPISYGGSRKRKAQYVENFPSPPHTPRFSSTLNESLMENLEKFHLQNESLSLTSKGEV